jgi:hypothetical protein
MLDLAGLADAAWVGEANTRIGERMAVVIAIRMDPDIITSIREDG